MIKRYYSTLSSAILLALSTAANANHSAMVKDAWIADAPPVAKIRAGYLILHNHGKHTIAIKSFTSNDFERIELHKTVVKGEMIGMEKIDTLKVEAGKQVMFKPGSYHLMLFNPKRRLNKGDKINIQLELKDNKKTNFIAVVKDRGDKGHQGHEHHHHHH